MIYLIFNEGYSATAGDDWMRPALCDEALRLGRILAELVPQRAGGARPRRADGDPGLAHRARASAPTGEPVLLLDQNRARWDQLLIRRGLAALARAEALGGARGPYALQAAIAACHARARAAARPTGRASPRCTTRCAELTPSPVVELNRAVAVSMAFGPAAGLALVDALHATSPRSKGYHLLPSVRGDLLVQAGPPRRGARRSSSAPPALDAQRARAGAAARTRAACLDGPAG